MSSRRTFLVSTGALIAGAQPVTADPDEEVPAEDVGLEEEIEELLAAGEVEEARRLMDEHDVRYSTSRQSVTVQAERNRNVGVSGSAIESGESGGAISPEGVYVEGEGEISCTVVNLRRSDLWLASGNFFHDGAWSYSVRDYASAPDVSVLYWDDSKWTAPDLSGENVSAYERGRHSVEYDQYRSSGTSAEVNLHWGGGWIDLTHQTKLYKEFSGSDYPIGYQYSHTIAPTSHGGVSVSFGPVSVSVGGQGTVVWSEDVSATP